MCKKTIKTKIKIFKSKVYYFFFQLVQSWESQEGIYQRGCVSSAQKMKTADLIFNGISKESLGMWFHRQDDALTEAGSRSGFVHRNSAWERTCDGKLVEGCEDMEHALQNKQTFSQNEVETLMRGQRLSCHEHLACANGDLYRPIAPGVVVSFDKKQIVPGTEWAPLRSVTPKHELLQNENLTRALQNKKSFSEAEITDMNLSEVKPKHYVQCGARRLRPVITNPGSKMFGVFETKDLVQELLSQHQGHCFFYEVILNRDTCLYFDLEGEFPSEKGLTLDEARDVLLGTVKQVCGALKTFCEICKIDCSDKIQLLESSRQKPDGSMKASFHMIIKSLHFKSNVESGLMEFFVYAIKHLIGDTEDYIDVAVYTQMRNLRILGSEKRLLGDHGSGKLKKVNIGETMEIQYDMDDRSKRDMTPEDYQDKMRIDLEQSLVSNVYPESILVTAEHVCAFEQYVERARVGLQWEKCKVAAQKGNVKIESQFLKDILGRRNHLTRAELDQVCTEIGDFVSSKASVVIGDEGQQTVFRPAVHNSKRFMNSKGGKQKVSKRTVVQVAAPSTDLEPVLKTAKVDNGQMPMFAQKIFCGATTRIKPITTDQYDLFHYAKDCIELQVLREENIKKFYIENPARCPIDWCCICDSLIQPECNHAGFFICL